MVYPVWPNSTTDGYYSNDAYYTERTTEKEDGTLSIWNGQIALIHLSDYGYATDLSLCSGTLEGAYNTEACYSNDWIHNGENQWLLTAVPQNSGRAWYIGKSEGFYDVWGWSGNSVNSSQSVRPALYLDPTLGIDTNTDGSSTNPYKLIVK